MTATIHRLGRPKPPAPQPAPMGDECPCAACNPPAAVRRVHPNSEVRP